MAVEFMRNKWVEVVRESQKTLRVQGHIRDTVTSLTMGLEVRLPDLEIVSADAKLERVPYAVCEDVDRLMRKARGVRIGPGLRKIGTGIMGGLSGCPVVVNLFMECCNAVILSFTLPQLERILKGSEEERVDGFRQMLKTNPRLQRSCVAFADDSPLMKGL